MRAARVCDFGMRMGRNGRTGGDLVQEATADEFQYDDEDDYLVPPAPPPPPTEAIAPTLVPPRMPTPIAAYVQRSSPRHHPLHPTEPPPERPGPSHYKPAPGIGDGIRVGLSPRSFPRQARHFNTGAQAINAGGHFSTAPVHHIGSALVLATCRMLEAEGAALLAEGVKHDGEKHDGGKHASVGSGGGNARRFGGSSARGSSSSRGHFTNALVSVSRALPTKVPKPPREEGSIPSIAPLRKPAWSGSRSFYDRPLPSSHGPAMSEAELDELLQVEASARQAKEAAHEAAMAEKADVRWEAADRRKEPKGLTPKTRLLWRSFCTADADDDGTLSVDELLDGLALARVADIPKIEKFVHNKRHIQLDAEGNLDWDNFLKLYERFPAVADLMRSMSASNRSNLASDEGTKRELMRSKGGSPGADSKGGSSRVQTPVLYSPAPSRAPSRASV